MFLLLFFFFFFFFLKLNKTNILCFLICFPYGKFGAMADLRYTRFREITIIYWIFTVFLFVMLALFYYLGLTSNTVFNLITALWT